MKEQTTQKKELQIRLYWPGKRSIDFFTRCVRKCNVKSFITSLGLVSVCVCVSLCPPIFKLFSWFVSLQSIQPGASEPARKSTRARSRHRDYFLRARLSNRMTEVLKRGDMSLINCTVSEKRSLPNVIEIRINARMHSNVHTIANMQCREIRVILLI